jgi:hypothetical protein
MMALGIIQAALYQSNQILFLAKSHFLVLLEKPCLSDAIKVGEEEISKKG